MSRYIQLSTHVIFYFSCICTNVLSDKLVVYFVRLKHNFIKHVDFCECTISHKILLSTLNYCHILALNLENLI